MTELHFGRQSALIFWTMLPPSNITITERQTTRICLQGKRRDSFQPPNIFQTVLLNICSYSHHGKINAISESSSIQETCHLKNAKSIATRTSKLKLLIPQSRNYLCEYLLVTTLDLQTVLLSPSSKSAALCYETKVCCHNFTLYNLPPPLPHRHI